MKEASGLAQSVQTRLVRTARELGVDPNLILSRYAAERFLHRLSRSRHANRFVLKGAMMLLVWIGDIVRPTRDVDLLGIGELTDDAIMETFREIAALEVEPDGVVFDPSSITVAPIRAEDAYGGRRVTLSGHLGPARLRVQVDIGIGDAVCPDPEWIEYPSLLDLPRPRLRAYRPETSIAEKLHAMTILGSRNSRMRDFFDIRALAAAEEFEGDLLVAAIRATFERRGTPVQRRPLALTPAFADVEAKPEQWRAFLRKNGLKEIELAAVVSEIAAFLAPAIDAAADNRPFTAVWPPGGPWQP